LVGADRRLGFLPLHAAGRGDPPAAMASVMDRVISSYTPTIRVLEHARAQARTDGPPPEALIISVAGAEGHLTLAGAAAEAAAVGARLPMARLLADEEATTDRVLTALAGAPLAHFACHARSDATATSSGRLILHDGPLSLTDINGLRASTGQLAFLSACTTAQGSIGLLDEAIHLASAFQLAGYAHVIGTLWPAADSVAVGVAAAFYDRFAAGRPASAALHDAVMSVRTGSSRTPSLWASYIHVGPLLPR
jgi:CHAT domain-containing protein